MMMTIKQTMIPKKMKKRQGINFPASSMLRMGAYRLSQFSPVR